jgi:hypothetical protein
MGGTAVCVSDLESLLSSEKDTMSGMSENEQELEIDLFTFGLSSVE